MRKKIILTVVLIFSMVAGSSISINASAITNILKWDGLLYISDQDVAKNEINVNTGTDKDNNPTSKNLVVKSIKSDSVKQINANMYKYVCIDGDLANNVDVKLKALELYQNGATIILKKLGIKMKDVYSYFDVQYTNSNEFANDIDSYSDSSDKLKVVGISIYKDNAGSVHTTIISAEEYSKNESVDYAFAYSIAVKPQTTSDLAPKDTSNQIVSFNNGAAYASDPGWTISASNSWVDNWTSVTISYTAFLEKYPSNPDGQGYYYFLEYSPMILSPKIDTRTGLYFGIGTMRFNKYSNSSTVVDLGPKPQSITSTLSVSVGAPLGCSFSFSVGNSVSTSVENGIGSYTTTWVFTPKYAGISYPTTNQLSFELINMYKKSTSSFQIINGYEVAMCYQNTQGGIWFSYGTASTAGRSVSGT